MKKPRIKLLISDVDGTLLTSNHVLTEQSTRAVKQLGDAGILFAITSGRPPRGLSMLIDPLRLTTPLGAFNGGLIVDCDMNFLQELTIPDNLVTPIIELLSANGLSVWVYQGSDWFVLDLNGPHVLHNSRACQFTPSEVTNFNEINRRVVKIVGVSDEPSVMRIVEAKLQHQFGHDVSATRSSAYYLDVTHRDANKGAVVHFFSSKFDIATADIATIGDMSNDLLMFEMSGLSIAMGNADGDVQHAADHVSRSNDDDGFAYAIDQFILNSQ